MKLEILLIGGLAAALAGGCSQLGSEDGKARLSDERAPTSPIGLEGDEDVPLDQVPALVLNAALAAVPGMQVDAAEAEVEDGVLIYALAGTDGGEPVEVDVTDAGEVLKIERGDEVGEEHGDDEGGEDGDDEQIPLDQVPALVLNAALAAVPGFALEKAELEVEDGIRVYCLQGLVGGEEVEVDVTADGQVLEVESGDEGEEDEDDD